MKIKLTERQKEYIWIAVIIIGVLISAVCIVTDLGDAFKDFDWSGNNPFDGISEDVESIKDAVDGADDIKDDEEYKEIVSEIESELSEDEIHQEYESEKQEIQNEYDEGE